MPEEITTAEVKEPRITVDYKPGRWGNMYHLFDLEGREIILVHKDATKLARNILRIAGEEVK
jgi:hypothetical protein